LLIIIHQVDIRHVISVHILLMSDQTFGRFTY
jgi:hypothetical protein